MRQLSDQELNAKITRFLDSRFAEHPEIAEIEEAQGTHLSEKLVSRVKNISKKFGSNSHIKSRTLYQS